jgi:hypothetical protein
MTPPQILTDFIRLMVALAPAGGLVCLVLAGISLRVEGGPRALVGGQFAKWMFWAIVFVTLPQLIAWFPSLGVPAPLPSGTPSTGWMASIQNEVTNFMSNFVIGRLVTSLAAFFVIRAILDTVQGGHPLPSILAAMFLLGVQSTLTLIQGYDSGTQYATADVLDGLWNYLAVQILPITAGLTIIGAVFNFATNRPVMPMVGAALALLTTSAVWRLVTRMM